MDILIGQKRKNQNKKQEQKPHSANKEQDKQEPENKEEETKKEFKHGPINPSKVIYLDNFAYIEQVDHRMRLVTHDYEMYY